MNSEKLNKNKNYRWNKWYIILVSICVNSWERICVFIYYFVPVLILVVINK